MLVDVVLPLGLPYPLTYRLPDSLEAKTHPGSRVVVPLGRRRAVGIILKTTEKVPEGTSLKLIESVLDEAPLLTPSELRLLIWASEYYLTPPGEVLRHIVPTRYLRIGPRRDRATRPEDPGESSDLGPALPHRGQLTEAQAAAVSRVEQTPGAAYLLHGITGSGKTSVYIRLAKQVIASGGQVLVLVPEIGLTPQAVTRFREGIGREVTAYHSGLTPPQRARIWEACRLGEIPLVVGTRSAVFLSFPSLKLIVVDEEHDGSFKQEERFCYSARDLALWRNREEKVALVMGSATPSLEAIHLVRKERITRLILPERPGTARLPEVIVIDRRRSDEKAPISPELGQALRENFKKKEQSLLFLNRRGFAPFLLCAPCGYIPRCDGCDISLTYHQKGNLLICHYCDGEQPYFPVCPRCGGILHPFGVGTQRLERELEALLPSARIARLDRDTARGKGGFKILEAFQKREIDVLIGTQMVTKGHDFPHLTLVGIIDADVALNLPDFRSGERAFQLLTQVAGRAGRAEHPGRVMIQTFQPDHPSLVAAARHETEGFYERELKERNEAGYPPFVRLIQVRFTGTKKERVSGAARAFAERVSRQIPEGLSRLLGPAPCPLERLRGRTRWHLLLKTARISQLQPLLRRLLTDFQEDGLPSGVRLLVNVDPLEMM